jgi:CheY-like chemotaxis protein
MITDFDPIIHSSPPNQRLDGQAAAILEKSSYPEIRSIVCEAHGNLLTLSGSVPTYFHKQLAQASLLNWLGGDVKIENNLIVTSLSKKPSPKLQMSKKNDSGADGDGSPRLRVLIVDDRETDGFLLMQLLQVMGHIVDQACDGEEALQKVEDFAPHLILCDIVMPVMNGYELAQQLKGRAGRPKLVAITGYSEPGDREQAMACGFDEYLVKPVEIKELQRLLAAHSAKILADGRH